MKTNNKYRVYTMPDGMDCKFESLEKAVKLFVLTFQSPYENEVRLAKLNGSGFTGAEFDDIDIDTLEKFTALTGGLVSDGELVAIKKDCISACDSDVWCGDLTFSSVDDLRKYASELM